jgi:hypothetical protein
MRYALILLVGLSTLAFAAEPAVEEKIKTLITKLGDDDPKARDSASKELRKIGKDAKAALAEAKKSDDAEVAARAEAIEKLIEQDAKPKTTVTPAIPRGRPMMGGVSVRVSTSAGPGGKTKNVTVTEPGRVVNITEDKDGVAMQVTEGDETKEYKAKDADTLKKEHPEVAAVYDKYAKAGAAQVQIGQIQIGGLEGLQGIEGLPKADQARIKAMLERAQKQQERVQKLMEEMQKQMLEDLNQER